MASGHVNRIKRPNTWLHRPMLQNVKKVLANPEPSTHGTKRSLRCSRRVSVAGGETENMCSARVFRLLTRTELALLWLRCGHQEFCTRIAVEQFERVA